MGIGVGFKIAASIPVLFPIKLCQLICKNEYVRKLK